MKKEFTPLIFLASLGAGGIAVMPFVLMQYSLEHGAGLLTHAQVPFNDFSWFTAIYFYCLEGIMIVFALFHIALTLVYLKHLFGWITKPSAKELINDPLKSTAILAPFISITMTMNVFIGPIRYFIPFFSNNFQSLMLPAMIFWSILFVALLWTEIYLLKNSFEKGFDVNRINFGWLLHPFALGMITVVGTGIAAMAKNSSIAHTAAFMSMVSGSMGLFLLLVKLVMLFKSHMQAGELPEKHFLPSFLIVIPNITLFAISGFRLGHYLEQHHSFHLDYYFLLVIGLAFAFETWYMLFGGALLIDYFKKHHFNDYYVTQWGFICPIVAYGVLGSFMYKLFVPSEILYTVIVGFIVLAVLFYVELLKKHLQCAGTLQKNELNC